MPYYEYECVQCGNKHTLRASMTEKKPAGIEMYCDKCEYHTVFERILSPFSGKFGDTPRHHR